MKNIEILNITNLLNGLNIKNLNSDDFLNLILLKQDLDSEYGKIQEYSKKIVESVKSNERTEEESKSLIEKYLMNDSEFEEKHKISKDGLLNICNNNELKMDLIMFLNKHFVL